LLEAGHEVAAEAAGLLALRMQEQAAAAYLSTQLLHAADDILEQRGSEAEKTSPPTSNPDVYVRTDRQ
jgi:hypothetical protein